MGRLVFSSCRNRIDSLCGKAVNINKPEAASADIGVMSNLPNVPESQTPNAELPLVTPEVSAPVVPKTTTPEAIEQVPATEPVAEDKKKQ